MSKVFAIYYGGTSRIISVSVISEKNNIFWVTISEVNKKYFKKCSSDEAEVCIKADKKYYSVKCECTNNDEEEIENRRPDDSSKFEKLKVKLSKLDYSKYNIQTGCYIILLGIVSENI